MKIGLGLAALGRPGYLNLGHGADLGSDRSVDALRRRAHAVLDVAYAGGVRAFDAARSYGRAEEFLGQWLDSRRPQGVRVSSQPSISGRRGRSPRVRSRSRGARAVPAAGGALGP
jgi:aryl-alcohol dehydrogenase-like predicted oxidoreductase